MGSIPPWAAASPAARLGPDLLSQASTPYSFLLRPGLRLPLLAHPPPLICLLQSSLEGSCSDAACSREASLIFREQWSFSAQNPLRVAHSCAYFLLLELRGCCLPHLHIHRCLLNEPFFFFFDKVKCWSSERLGDLS